MPEVRRRRGFLKPKAEKPAPEVPAAPKQPKATPPPKKSAPPVRVGPAHYRTILTTYWAKAHGPEVVADFAQRMRADLSADEIKNEIIPMLPAASLGTTGVQVARLRAALERVAAS